MKRGSFSRAFTAAEMLVATALGSMIVGAAALGYHTLVLAQRSYTSVTTVRIGSAAMKPFYGSTSNSITTFVAPNYGSVARAEALREKFIADTVSAIAVYCLPRATGTYNTIHPAAITSPGHGTAMDTPEAFRLYINTVVPNASAIFNQSFRNTAALPCYTIFILGYSANPTTIPVIAVYDIDLITATDAADFVTTVGTYASVRRYTAATLSAYYDILYKTGNATQSFTPPVVAFERRTRKAIVEGSTTIDRFKVAAEQPFYFIFWPDPAREYLNLPLPNTVSSLNPSFATTDPRKAYNHMAGRTSYMFTVPMFPSG
jgi:hypothetical protein